LPRGRKTKDKEEPQAKEEELFQQIEQPESRQVVENPWGFSPGLAGAELTTAQGSGA
jgi:hypothetical protein